LGGIAKIYPAHFFVMSSVFQSLAASCVGLALICGAASTDAAPPGLLNGHLKIISLREVELADGENTRTTTPQAYSEYPLVVLSGDGKREITRLTADAQGNYRAELPPGDYVLDVHERTRKHARAKPKPFTVVSNQTVRVDMDIDTGIR
jgi:hypothetical protein